MYFSDSGFEVPLLMPSERRSLPRFVPLSALTSASVSAEEGLRGAAQGAGVDARVAMERNQEEAGGRRALQGRGQLQSPRGLVPRLHQDAGQRGESRPISIHYITRLMQDSDDDEKREKKKKEEQEKVGHFVFGL